MDYKLIAPIKPGIAPLEQVLSNRGLSREEMSALLKIDIEPINLDPYGLNNIEIAAKTLLSALVQQQKIYLQVDCDCDGYTSSAALLNYLHKIFPSSVENLITYDLHSSKHHGLSVNAIADDIQLVIVPDASSNESNIHKELLDRGIKTIVLDHHEYEENAPQYAIIVNNQAGNYQNRTLSGVGVVYKFCQVLDAMLEVSYADDILDLVALGMIADMMDTKSLETRSLIFQGLKNVRNPFFSGLAEKNSFSMKGEINIFTVSWYIAPYVNAMTRTGSDDEKRILFQSMLDYEAYKLIPSTKRGCKGQEETLLTQALRTCTTVKRHQDDTKREYLPIIRQQIEDENLLQEPIVIVKLHNDIDGNLIGLLANQIMGEIGKPIIILRHIEDENTHEMIWTGSARGFETEHVKNWREFINESGCAIFAEGHALAFGTAFTESGVEKFARYAQEKFGTEPFSRYYEVDFDWNSLDNMDDAILDIARYTELWGQGLSEPLVAINNIPVTKDSMFLMGKGTVKIQIPNRKTNCIRFDSEDIYKDIANHWDNKGEGTVYVTLIGTCAVNDYMGRVTPQIKFKDYRIESSTRWVF